MSTPEGRAQVIKAAMKMSVGMDQYLERLTSPLVIIGYKASAKAMGEDTELAKNYLDVLHYLELARSANMKFVSQALLETGAMEMTPEVEKALKDLQDAIDAKLTARGEE